MPKNSRLGVPSVDVGARPEMPPNGRPITGGIRCWGGMLNWPITVNAGSAGRGCADGRRCRTHPLDASANTRAMKLRTAQLSCHQAVGSGHLEVRGPGIEARQVLPAFLRNDGGFVIGSGDRLHALDRFPQDHGDELDLAAWKRAPHQAAAHVAGDLAQSRKQLGFQLRLVRVRMFGRRVSVPESCNHDYLGGRNARDISSLVTSRHSPGCSVPSSMPPNATRSSRVTSWPVASSSRRISRCLPSVSSTTRCDSRLDRLITFTDCARRPWMPRSISRASSSVTRPRAVTT